MGERRERVAVEGRAANERIKGGSEPLLDAPYLFELSLAPASVTPSR